MKVSRGSSTIAPESPECPNGPFLVMELVDGPSVSDLLAEGPLSAVRSLDIVAQVAAALDVAHRAGLVHGDVRPQNMLVTCDGVVKLVDLVAAHWRGPAGATAAAPALDLYGLGLAAHQCLTGMLLDMPVGEAITSGNPYGGLPALPVVCRNQWPNSSAI